MPSHKPKDDFLRTLLSLYRSLSTAPAGNSNAVAATVNAVRKVHWYMRSTLFYHIADQHPRLATALDKWVHLLNASSAKPSPDAGRELKTPKQYDTTGTESLARSTVLAELPAALLGLGYRIDNRELAKALARLQKHLQTLNSLDRNTLMIDAFNKLNNKSTPFRIALGLKNRKLLLALFEWMRAWSAYQFSIHRIRQGTIGLADHQKRLSDRFQAKERQILALLPAALDNVLMLPPKNTQHRRTRRRHLDQPAKYNTKPIPGLVWQMHNMMNSTLCFHFRATYPKLSSAIDGWAQVLKAMQSRSATPRSQGSRSPSTENLIKTERDSIRRFKSTVLAEAPEVLIRLGYRMNNKPLAQALLILQVELQKRDVKTRTRVSVIAEAFKILDDTGTAFSSAMSTRHDGLVNALKNWQNAWNTFSPVWNLEQQPHEAFANVQRYESDIKRLLPAALNNLVLPTKRQQKSTRSHTVR